MPGPKPNPKSLRRAGKRPPPVLPEVYALLEAIAQSRNLSKGKVIEMGLRAIATPKEIERAKK